MTWWQEASGCPTKELRDEGAAEYPYSSPRVAPVKEGVPMAKACRLAVLVWVELREWQVASWFLG